MEAIMNIDNLTLNKMQRDTVLMAVKLELVELLAEARNYDFSTSPIRGAIWNRIDKIDELLDGGSYELEANLDHITENQNNE
jgi:hypothetical protein